MASEAAAMARLSLSHDKEKEVGNVKGGGIWRVSLSGTSVAVPPPPPPATKGSEELKEKWKMCLAADKDAGECLDDAERAGLDLLQLPREFYEEHGITLEQRRSRLAPRVYRKGKPVRITRDPFAPLAKLLELGITPKSPYVPRERPPGSVGGIGGEAGAVQNGLLSARRRRDPFAPSAKLLELGITPKSPYVPWERTPGSVGGIGGKAAPENNVAVSADTVPVYSGGRVGKAWITRIRR